MKAFFIDRYGSKGSLFGWRNARKPSTARGSRIGTNPCRKREFAGHQDQEWRVQELPALSLPAHPRARCGWDRRHVGPRVRQFRPGDEVYSRPDDFRIGAFAELIAIKEDSLAIKPETLSMEEAASIPLVGLTAWQALIEKADFKKEGEKVFIQAGSGGVAGHSQSNLQSI